MKADIDRKSARERIAGQSTALGALIVASAIFATSCKSSGSNDGADGSVGSGGASGSPGESGGSTGAPSAGGTTGTSGVGGTSGTAGMGGALDTGGSGGANGGGGTNGNGGTSGNGGTNGTGGTNSMGSGGASVDAGIEAGATANSLPGDIAAAAGTPLVAAHSMTRALYAAYDGALFQVRRASDGNTKDIHPTRAGGYADEDALNTFCTGTGCSVSSLYDQSGNANDLPQQNPSNQPTVEYWTTSGSTKVPMAVTEHQQWLRNRTQTHMIPMGSASQTEYMVVHGAYFNNGCCYDYGNMERNVGDDGAGTMSALYFGSDTDWTRGAGSGPWAMADYENGLFSGNYADPNMGKSSVNPNNPTIAYPGNNIVTVLSKTDGTTSWVLKAGNAATGPLNTYWNGTLPNGYSSLQQQGGLSLGEGGDGSNSGTGAFSEGVVIADVTTDDTDDRIQANLTSVYGR